MNRPRLSSAHLLAGSALFVALGGTSIAATQLGRNAVHGANIANGAVTSAKVKDHSLLARDFKPGQLAAPHGLAGPAGPTGPAGATGAAGPGGADGARGPVGAGGPAGPAGPSDVYAAGIAHTAIGTTTTDVASVLVPAGSYVVQAKTGAGVSAAAAAVSCFVRPASADGDFQGTTVPANGAANLALSFVATFDAPTELTLQCFADAPGVEAENADVIATRTQALHGSTPADAV